MEDEMNEMNEEPIMEAEVVEPVQAIEEPSLEVEEEIEDEPGFLGIPSDWEEPSYW